MAGPCQGTPGTRKIIEKPSELASNLQVLSLLIKDYDLVPFVLFKAHRLQCVLLDELYPLVLLRHGGPVALGPRECLALVAPSRGI